MIIKRQNKLITKVIDVHEITYDELQSAIDVLSQYCKGHVKCKGCVFDSWFGCKIMNHKPNELKGWVRFDD